jgi:hypothetical protein
MFHPLPSLNRHANLVIYFKAASTDEIVFLQAAKHLQQSLSYSSSCLSASEFFDAQEFQSNLAISETSSEASLSSEEGSVISENSEVGADHTPAQSSTN